MLRVKYVKAKFIMIYADNASVNWKSGPPTPATWIGGEFNIVGHALKQR